jgi:hypothetical protein
LQALGIDDPTTCEEQQQSAAASALKLPWLGFILGNAVVPSQGSLAGEVFKCALQERLAFRTVLGEVQLAGYAALTCSGRASTGCRHSLLQV